MNTSVVNEATWHSVCFQSTDFHTEHTHTHAHTLAHKYRQSISSEQHFAYTVPI